MYVLVLLAVRNLTWVLAGKCCIQLRCALSVSCEFNQCYTCLWQVGFVLAVQCPF